jgi:hypothetical protein
MNGGIVILAIMAVIALIKNRIAKKKLMDGVPLAYEPRVINEERQTRWMFWSFICPAIACGSISQPANLAISEEFDHHGHSRVVTGLDVAPRWDLPLEHT